MAFLAQELHRFDPSREGLTIQTLTQFVESLIPQSRGRSGHESAWNPFRNETSSGFERSGAERERKKPPQPAARRVAVDAEGRNTASADAAYFRIDRDGPA
ncbi:MAG TPA: hypothetical protein PLS90_00845 [Candidatus Sumerlaeota bacterium]|nr:hypothetical protein [Candidatus Sumerlaeota bacterium]HOR27905.1 hypothetical protein [Candidatus Sumerlaeota bacterium]HPK00978.1 hypothetical protein [Candidatus Sumerlaeota bacterium]